MALRNAVQNQGLSVVNAPRSRRVPRRPQHTFYLRQVPFTIQPFMIAPVLPGETLQNLSFQARCVTMPIKNPIIGWWCEYYFFYVKLTDLDEREAFMDLMINPDNSTVAALKETDDTVSMFFNPGANSSINYIEMCLKRVTEDFFRTADEAWDNVTINGLPLASVVGNSVLDSFINDDAFQTSIEPTIDTSQASVGITVIEAAMRRWELLKLDNMTDLSYEDYLRSYGVNIADAAHRPELIRFVRDWQYPSNTVDPSTGSPTSAVSWAIRERADKNRYFKEPGFVFGVTVVRPKLYFGNQSEPVVNFLDDVYAWLPAVLNQDSNTSLRQFTAGTGPFKSNTDDYWLDLKDLFMYGDMFTNIAPKTTGTNSLALPTAGGVWKYPTNQAMLDELFVSANAYCHVDGIVSMNVSGNLTDTT